VVGEGGTVPGDVIHSSARGHGSILAGKVCIVESSIFVGGKTHKLKKKKLGTTGGWWRGGGCKHCE